jgi:hypothetical protein
VCDKKGNRKKYEKWGKIKMRVKMMQIERRGKKKGKQEGQKD